MDKKATIAQLRATQITLTAAHAQLEAQMIALQDEGDQEEEHGEPCPKCGATDGARAGDVTVCAKCGANFSGGVVVE